MIHHPSEYWEYQATDTTSKANYTTRNSDEDDNEQG